jgi:RNA recognition motif-containing protein
MAKKLFVGNINWSASKEDLEDIFSQYGELEEIILVRDENGRSKGFGFISYVNEEDAKKAIVELNGFQIDGRPLFINEARPQEKRERNFR